MSRSDIIVVGAGIVGAATAFLLAKEGLRVTLIEEHRPGWGASGRNQGFQGLHTRKAGVELQLARWGRALNEQLASEIGPFGMRCCGGMTLVRDAADIPFAEAFVASRICDGLPMQLLTPDEARERCPILKSDIAGAIWNPLDAHHDTTVLCEKLSAASNALGVRQIFGAPVDALLMAGNRCEGVRIGQERYAADCVVLAAGTWTARLVAPHGIELPFTPMRLQAALTETAPFLIDPLVYGPFTPETYAAFKQVDGYRPERFAHPGRENYPGMMQLDCIAQRPDGRIMLGCPLDFPGIVDRPSVGGIGWMLSSLAELFPALADLALEQIWAGVAPLTPDLLPIIGSVPGFRGVLLNTGHAFGNLSAMPSAAMIAAEFSGAGTPVPIDALSLDRSTLAKEGLESRFGSLHGRDRLA